MYFDYSKHHLGMEVAYLTEGKEQRGGTYCVAFCSTHHLSMVQPLGGKHFVKGSEMKFSLLQEAGKLLGCISI